MFNKIPMYYTEGYSYDYSVANTLVQKNNDSNISAFLEQSSSVNKFFAH